VLGLNSDEGEKIESTLSWPHGVYYLVGKVGKVAVFLSPEIIL